MPRHVLVYLLAFLALAFTPAVSFAAPIVVTDILGREVRLDRPATRIVLGQGRHIQALALIHPDPASLVIGWKDDLKRDKATYDAYVKKFPALDAVPSVGQSGDASFSVEKTIALKPDLVLLSLTIGEASDEAMMKQITGKLEQAGIPVAFVDFFVRPLRDTRQSLQVLGKLIGREDRTEAFLSFYDAHLQRISSRITEQVPRPEVFMQVHASGASCCYSPGQGVFNDFLTFAGGRNIAADILPGTTGKVSLEYLIKRDPRYFIATGGGYMTARGGLVLGTGIDAATAQASFKALLASPGLADLTAVGEGRTLGLWHLFNDSPILLLMIEALAKRLHPELFADLDPDKTLADLNRDFLTVPLEGTFWVGAK